MNKYFFWFCIFLGKTLFAQFSEVYTHDLSSEEKETNICTWEMTDSIAFDELVLTWVAKRPQAGRYSFFVSICQEENWSPWLYYGEWGAVGQIMFKDIPKDSFAFAHEGKIAPKKGECNGFRIQIEASGGAYLENVESFSATLLSHSRFIPVSSSLLSSILLDPFPRQSHIMLRHPRSYDMSLPICMTLALNYLYQEKKFHPLDFAEKTVDDDTEFYENWSFNAAEASSRGKPCHVAYLPDFASLHSYLMEGIPVIVPISGWMPGSFRYHRTEHAICIIGYSAEEDKIYCIDSALPNDKSTFVSYSLPDFLKTWAKHCNKALIFGQRSFRSSSSCRICSAD